MCLHIYTCTLLSQRVTESTVVDEKMYGGNASAEGGGDEGADDAAQTGCNIVLANRLQQTTFTKKLYQTHIKVHVHVCRHVNYCP